MKFKERRKLIGVMVDNKLCWKPYTIYIKAKI